MRPDKVVKKWIYENWKLKLLSLIFAITLWFFIMGEEFTETAFTVPIEFRNVPSSMEIISSESDYVDVRVKGLRSNVARLSTRDIKILLDLKDVSKGETAFLLLPENVIIPRGIQVMRINPSKIKVILERTTNLKAHVIPRITGNPAPGYRVIRVSANPPDVEIKGPESEVGKLRSIETDPLNIDGIKASVTHHAKFSILGGKARLVEKKPVEIKVEVEEISITRKISGIPVRIIESSWNATISPDSIELVVKGPISMVNKITPVDINVEINLKDLPPKSYKLKPKFSLPGNVTVVSYSPRLFQVALTQSK